MAPHFLSLTLEIRLHILEYAIQPDKFAMCKERNAVLEKDEWEGCTCRRQTPPPSAVSTYLKLICKQLSREIALLPEPKLELTVCNIGLGAAWIQSNRPRFEGHVCLVRRHYTYDDLKDRTSSWLTRDELGDWKELEDYVKEVVDVKSIPYRPKIEFKISGKVESPDGADVLIYL